MFEDVLCKYIVTYINNLAVKTISCHECISRRTAVILDIVVFNDEAILSQGTKVGHMNVWVMPGYIIIA